MDNPARIGDILARHCWACLQPATVLLTSPGREVQACTRCEPSARRWAATTGPVTTTPITNPSHNEKETLF